MSNPGDKPDPKTIGDMVREAQAAMANWPAWMRDAAYVDAKTLRHGKGICADHFTPACTCRTVYSGN